jgi:hypothetical protein
MAMLGDAAKYSGSGSRESPTILEYVLEYHRGEAGEYFATSAVLY